MTTALSGKTCIITGGTGGIGKETALGLARLGARVVLIGRDPKRTAAVVQELQAATGNQEIEYLLADLSSQAGVRSLAAEILAKYERIDLLINNAGGLFNSRQETVDGLEMTFAFNHLGYFLLTNLLLERIVASGPARIVSVSSAAHRMGKLDFTDLQAKRSYSAWRAYGTSKLANILFTTELARRLEGTGVTANCLHPGTVATNFGGESWAMRIARPFFISAAQGAETSIYLASAPEVANVTGQYFEKKRIARPSRAAVDQEAASRLWSISEVLTHLNREAD